MECFKLALRCLCVVFLREQKNSESKEEDEMHEGDCDDGALCFCKSKGLISPHTSVPAEEVHSQILSRQNFHPFLWRGIHFFCVSNIYYLQLKEKTGTCFEEQSTKVHLNYKCVVYQFININTIKCPSLVRLANW